MKIVHLAYLSVMDILYILLRFYFGKISPPSAESLLMGNPSNINGSYLIRAEAKVLIVYVATIMVCNYRSIRGRMAVQLAPNRAFDHNCHHVFVLCK